MLVALENMGLSEGGLKWPNDILVGGKKLAGVLCEVASAKHIVAGIGINVDYPSGYLPAANATSLRICGVNGVNAEDLCEDIVRSVSRQLRGWERFENPRLELLRTRMLTLGSRVRVLDTAGGDWTGYAEDITPEGHLVVIADGEAARRHILAADILHLRNSLED